MTPFVRLAVSKPVLVNLIMNGVKYGRKNDGEVSVSIFDLDDRFLIEVADNGMGIPESDINRVFERFYRVDSGLRRSTAGTGLGLFLSKEIVEAHGGQIWVRSEPGIGTTFFVALPTEEGQVSQDIQQVYSLPYTMNG